jgi:hypothetical protein
MWYWYNTTMELDTLYKLEKRKTEMYSKITGIQNNSIETLENFYKNKQAIDNETIYNSKKALDEVKKSNRNLKFLIGGLIVIDIGVIGIATYTIIKN